MNERSITKMVIPLKYTNPKYKAWAYLVPIMEDIKYNKFEGLSLEEIAHRFGKDTAQSIFNLASQGYGDLTKPTPVANGSESVECISLCLYTYTSGSTKKLRFQLIDNSYTQSDFCIDVHEVTLCHDIDEYSQLDHIIHQVINMLGDVDISKFEYVNTGE